VKTLQTCDGQDLHIEMAQKRKREASGFNRTTPLTVAI
jgi:hypothetical protein